MTPEELHAYVVTCWTDHRVAAQAATAGPWNYSFSSLHMNGSGTVRIAPAQGGPAITIGHFLNGADPIHITINNPDHVTVVCNSMLELLSRHMPVTEPFMEPFCRNMCARSAGVDRTYYVMPNVLAIYPCDAVLEIAAAFVTRPDFPHQLIRGERA